MAELSEFLLARYAEDHDVAYGAATSPWSIGSWDGKFDGPREILDRLGNVTAHAYYGGTVGHIERFDPTRVLADVEAKRRIVRATPVVCVFDGESWQLDDATLADLDQRVDFYSASEHQCPPRSGPHDTWTRGNVQPGKSAELTLRALASVYADHPDYQEEWAL